MNKNQKDLFWQKPKAERDKPEGHTLRDRLWEEAYKEQNQDPEFHKEVKLWDCTVGDGIPDDDVEFYDRTNDVWNREIDLGDEEIDDNEEFIGKQAALLDPEDSEEWFEREKELWQQE